MKRSLKFTLYYTFVVIGLFAFGVFLSKSLGTTFAISTGVDRSGFPTSTFTSNLTSDTKLNYMDTALKAGSISNSWVSNFAVPSGMKTSNGSTPLYILMKNYDVPKTTERFELGDGNPATISNKGLLYILAHGYNTTNPNYNIFATKTYGSVTDNNIKQYVTQIALWLYIVENKSSFSSTYCANDGCDFKDGSTVKTATEIRNLIKQAAGVTNYNYLNYITLLVDNAKKYTGGEDSKLSALSGTSFSYQINGDFTLLVTDTVTPSVTGNSTNYMYYSVEISDPNKYGVYLTDTNNNKITSTDVMSGSFKVAVPLKKDLTEMDLSSIEIKVYGHFVKDEGRDYRVTTKTTGALTKHDNFSNVTVGYVPSEVVGTSFKLYNFTKISKVDATNSKELPGATLVVTNKKDKTKKWTWVSEDKPHYMYLEDGEYELCETIAPEGYEVTTECIDMVIDGTKITAFEMKNEPTVPVPDTGLFKSKLPYAIGGFLILIGGIVSSVIIIRKKKESNI